MDFFEYIEQYMASNGDLVKKRAKLFDMPVGKPKGMPGEDYKRAHSKVIVPSLVKDMIEDLMKTNIFGGVKEICVTGAPIIFEGDHLLNALNFNCNASKTFSVDEFEINKNNCNRPLFGERVELYTIEVLESSIILGVTKRSLKKGGDRTYTQGEVDKLLEKQSEKFDLEFDESIENEVKARVEFKLNDIKDSIDNYISRNKYSTYPWDGTIELKKNNLYNDFRLLMVTNSFRVNKESMVVLNEIFKKEAHMPTPYDRMYEEKTRKQKDAFVDKIYGDFEDMTRGLRVSHSKSRMFLKKIIGEVEKLQREKKY